MSELGDRLSELRKDNQELQKDIADLLHVSPGSISNYETGTHLPTVEALCDLADHFGVTMDYLMGRTNTRASLNDLDKCFAGNITYGMLLEKVMELPEQKRALLWQLIEDMHFSSCFNRDTRKSGGNQHDSNPYPRH